MWVWRGSNDIEIVGPARVGEKDLALEKWSDQENNRWQYGEKKEFRDADCPSQRQRKGKVNGTSRPQGR